MPAMQEAPRPQPTGNIFERGLKAAARSKLVLPVVAAADIAGAVLGGAACGVQPRTSPSSEPPRSAEVRPTDPGATATAAAEIEKGRVNIPIIGKGVPAAPTPEPTPIPTKSPVEQAIEKGKIEIKTPAEWEKYFTLVSPSEARELLAQAKEKGEFKFLFPLDPRESPQLEIVPLKSEVWRGWSITSVGVKHVKPASTVYTPLDMKGKLNTGIQNVGSTPAEGSYSIQSLDLATDDYGLGIAIGRVGKPHSFLPGDPFGQENQFSTGQPVFFTPEKEKPLRRYGEDIDLVIDVSDRKNTGNYKASLASFVVKDGKFAFTTSGK